MSYQVKLQNFQGPLDLLLFLIKKNEVDIYDIPIAEITRQYLEYIQLMRQLDLKVAGEFILMAATLIRIKARMLLPVAEGVEEEEDPREELVHQLLEYKRFKEIASSLSLKEEEQRKLYPRSCFDSVEVSPNPAKEVSLFDLLWAFREVLKRLPETKPYEVEPVSVTVEEQIDFVLSFLATREKVSFFELVSRIEKRVVMIVTFVAILELIRTGRIKVRQSRPFEEIWIFKGNGS